MTVRILGLLLTFVPALGLGEDRYRAKFADDLSSVTVSACFKDRPPRSLYRHEDAGDFTDWIRSDQREIDNRSRYGRLRLPDLPPGSCVEWKVNLARVAQADRRAAARFDGGILLTGNLWFWRDDDGRDIRIDVEVPENHSISVPWQLITNEPLPAFRPDPTPASWTFRSAVGRFPVQTLDIEGTLLHLAAIGSLETSKRRDLEDWIQQTAASVASVHGAFPWPHAQVLVVPIGARSSPVPWGRVVRGGGVGIELFVDDTRSLAELQQDWTATHEFSHLLLPLVSSRDRWLSEGLASYYQNVLRARDGRLSEKQAWQKLLAGFERGRDGLRPGESLARATRSGWSSTMRVYWSGAAIMLMADARLRSVSDRRQSLDTALKDLHDCCWDTGRSWRAHELFSELDRLTGHEVFSDLYDRYVNSTDFPAVDETLDRLGVGSKDGSIRLRSNAPWSDIRSEIMSGPG